MTPRARHFGMVFVAALGLLGGGCGYRPLAAHAGSQGQLLRVVSGPRLVPEARAHDALVRAAAGRLAEAGELAGGAAYPRLEVDLIRIDETSEGVVARADRPAARALRVTVVGRGRVLRAAGEPPGLDTGDMSAHALVSAGGGATTALALREEAAIGAARELGRRLAERVLGLPSSSDEGLGRDF